MQDSKGRVRHLRSIEKAVPRALGSAPPATIEETAPRAIGSVPSATRVDMNFPGHAHVPIESSDEEDGLGPELDIEELEWAIDQLPDSEVAHVREALANVPWLGKRWRPKSRYATRRPDGSVGSLGALDFLRGPP